MPLVNMKNRSNYAPTTPPLATIWHGYWRPARRRGPQRAHAVEMASRADRLAGGKDPVIAGTLAAACAEAGRFSEAVASETRARDLATAQGNAALAQSLDQRLGLFRAGSPFRDPTPLSTGNGK